MRSFIGQWIEVNMDAPRARFGWLDGTDGDTGSFGGFTAVEVMLHGRLRGYAEQGRANTAIGGLSVAQGRVKRRR